MTKTFETFQSILINEIDKTKLYIQEVRKKKSTDVEEIILPQQLKYYIQGLQFSLDALNSIQDYYENSQDSGD
tara:strand:- start:533 stop:751 length:219 start_codon:yes stop_codon:yes gene_type:complete